MSESRLAIEYKTIHVKFAKYPIGVRPLVDGKSVCVTSVIIRSIHSVAGNPG